MRFRTFIFIILVLASESKSQDFRGRVLDRDTKEPIFGATVLGRSLSPTDVNGGFHLTNAQIGDTIKISHTAYTTYIFTVKATGEYFAGGAPFEILLAPKSILLTEVYVRSFRNAKSPSIENMKDFSSAFESKATGFKDIFILKSAGESLMRHVDVHKGNNPYTASNFVKLDVLNIARLLTKDNSSSAKLKMVLQKDEKEKLIDRTFSVEMITSLTTLTGDSVRTFMDRYRASWEFAREKTDYELIAYIKKSYKEFIK